jgi:hypothetical protein
MAGDRFFPRGTRGTIRSGGDSARARLLHDSEPDQERITVELLEDFICLEKGERTQVQRHEFTEGKAK